MYGSRFTLIAVAAIACLAQTPAQAQSWLVTTAFENHAIAPQLPVDYLLAAFGKGVVVNGASVIIQTDQALVLIDPVGSQAQYRKFGRPDIVVLTRASASHLSIDTMIGLLRRDTVVLAPQAIIDKLPLMIANNVITPFEVGMTQVVDGITFRALAPSDKAPNGAENYSRDRGDIGVMMEIDGAKTYF